MNIKACDNLNDVRVYVMDDIIKLDLTGTGWEVLDSTELDQSSSQGREGSSGHGKEQLVVNFFSTYTIQRRYFPYVR